MRMSSLPFLMTRSSSVAVIVEGCCAAGKVFCDLKSQLHNTIFFSSRRSLGSNALTGTIPAEFSSFNQLWNINLGGGYAAVLSHLLHQSLIGVFSPLPKHFQFPLLRRQSPLPPHASDLVLGGAGHNR